MNPDGICKCGCGGKTPLRQRGNSRLGHIKGEPCDYIGNHGVRANLKKGENHHKWNGGRKISNGYVLIWKKDHPRADYHGYVPEHILVAETMNGGPLPEGAEVHHKDRNRSNNLTDNLIIFRNHAEHMEIHSRERALKECGNPDYRKCAFCGEWDSPENMVRNKNQSSYVHPKHKRKFHHLSESHKQNISNSQKLRLERKRHDSLSSGN